MADGTFSEDEDPVATDVESPLEDPSSESSSPSAEEPVTSGERVRAPPTTCCGQKKRPRWAVGVLSKPESVQKRGGKGHVPPPPHPTRLGRIGQLSAHRTEELTQLRRKFDEKRSPHGIVVPHGTTTG